MPVSEAALSEERRRRLEYYRELRSLGELTASSIRDRGVYRGQAGIFVEKSRTATLTDNGSGVAVSILHTGSSYPDDLSEDGIIYHYPKTARPGNYDRNEVDALKAAKRLNLPVIVITYPSPDSQFRNVHLGWVTDWNDAERLFYLSFGESQPVESFHRDDAFEETPFQLTSNVTRPEHTALGRPGQSKFKFDVINRYGNTCVVCGLAVPQLLEAVHIRPKEEAGSDDPRNGLVLCANHHRAFDSHLFGINPENLEIVFQPTGHNNEELGISRENLSSLTRKPHQDALQWRWRRFRDHIRS